MTYEEILAECEKQGLAVMPKKTAKEHTFTVIARFERGLGPEYISLKPVTACKIGTAQELADYQASMYFQNTDILKEAVLKEVRIRPND